MKAPPTPYSLIWWIIDSRNANYHAYGPSFGIGSSASSSSGVQIYFGYSGENMTTIDVGVDTSSDFYRYGVEIVNNTVSWSFDDKIIYTYQTQRSGQEKYSFAVSIVSTVELPKAVSQIKQFDPQQYDNSPCILNDIMGTAISTYSDSPTCTCTQSTVTSSSFQTNAAIEGVTSANSTTTVSKATAAAAEVTDIPTIPGSMASYGEFQTQVYIDELSSISSVYQDSFILSVVASSSPSTHASIANRTSSSSTHPHSATIANSASSGIVGTVITSIIATTFILISVL